jgi:hypothetical protein
MVQSDAAVTTLSDAFSPVLQWLLIISGIGLGIGAAIFIVRAGWSFLTIFIGDNGGGSGFIGPREWDGLERDDRPDGL